ncbi:hypothetical protein [Flavobacterium facile]|uniref:hypothetical protein n=1 Tax=Flavobacterium facile TaxID=2893174 RepID=UPI002E75F290|nr:hypothetical protein [Flavobacterium sp. T-12]
MKKIFVLLLLCLSVLGFSQNKIINGKVETIIYTTDSTYYKNDVWNYEVHLIKYDDSISEKITTGSSSNFKFRLKKKWLKKYDAIEIISSEGHAAVNLKLLHKKDTINFLLMNLNNRQYFENYYSVGKPAIYLYPTIKSEISVKNDFKGKVMNTYPLYKNGWNVIAEPNGVLYNLDDKRTYNYLFWDGSYNFTKKHYRYENGFYIKKEDNIKFLQEKLELLGLNNTEINDFVVYWLPELNKNEENFIHFWVNDNIDNSSILTITPKPDTLLRIFMEFKAYHGEEKVPLQELTTTPRKGFTVVEWGGSNIDEPILK